MRGLILLKAFGGIYVFNSSWIQAQGESSSEAKLIQKGK